MLGVSVAVEVQRRVSCSRSEPVARTLPKADGTFRLTIDALPRGVNF